MSSSEKDTVDTVEKLLSERRKVSGWLDALANRRAETSPTVYQRVHDDYTAKLDKVQAKLLAASDAVQIAAADVATRLTDKEEAVVIKGDERAEAELRAAVGEYSEREWEKRRARLDEELAAVTTERNALRDELSRLRAVLDEVSQTGAPKGDLPEPEGTTVPGVADSAAAGNAAGESSAAMPAATDLDAASLPSIETFAEDARIAVDAGEGAVAVADLAFASGVTESTTGSDGSAVDGAIALPVIASDAGASAEAAPAPLAPAIAREWTVGGEDGVAASSAPTPVVSSEAIVLSPPVIPIHEQSIIAAVEPAQALAPSFDELAFLKSVTGRPTPPPTRPPMAGGAESSEASGAEREGGESARDGRSYAMPEPPIPFPDHIPEARVSQEMTPPRESFFGRPTPRTSEAVKSLRCQECGTLNYPTEWYCERCGGELAAL